jgi:hypothetical protein
MKECLACQQQFSPTRDWQDFCSTPCRMKFHYQRRKAQAVEDVEHRGMNGHGPRIDLAELGLIATPEKITRRF